MMDICSNLPFGLVATYVYLDNPQSCVLTSSEPEAPSQVVFYKWNPDHPILFKSFFVVLFIMDQIQGVENLSTSRIILHREISC